MNRDIASNSGGITAEVSLNGRFHVPGRSGVDSEFPAI